MLQPLIYLLWTWSVGFSIFALGMPASRADILPEQAPPVVPGAQLPGPEDGVGPGGDFSARIYREAIYSAGMDTGSLPGGGTFSCASAVCFVLNRVLGSPKVSPYLSELEHWLEANGKRITDMRQLRPGDLILSPHSLTVSGQAGIIGRKISNHPDFEIYANWAQNHLFVPSWSLRKWRQYFETRLGLDVVFFRVIRSPEKEQGETRESLLDCRRPPLFSLLSPSSGR
ncbi:hypothetical protein [Methylacidimicrobium sp. B4]|uniref:hypothetical protein n=1 Tax=Methylacidimicrobium sp. B4 TaxID=2796139 RepID=UPI001A8FE9A6|nr:hypothetical protein [Methylacidimicrobium sp. B4]QSR83945.1 hypothetical protein MacB4_06620 [Methylacidimicrobium sp. B4]